MHYTDIPGLADVDLGASFVLQIEATFTRLEICLDVALEASHHLYVLPEPDDFRCFRKGCLRFAGIASLSWASQGNPPAIDASGEIDMGHIEVFSFNQVYTIGGEFGTIVVDGDFPPVLDFG